MNWKLDNLSPEQELAIYRYGYVGTFLKVLMPRLLAAAPPETEAGTPRSLDIDPQSLNTYIPLAHRK